MNRFSVLLLLLLPLFSCRPEVYSPKPTGYFKVDTPGPHKYQLFELPGYPYSFEYPVYGEVKKDTVFLGEQEENPYWTNIVIPSLNGVINLTYKEISAKQPLNKLVEDAYGLSFFHHEKADYIDEKPFRYTNVTGVLYVVGGNSASRYQFTATDSVKHFIRGALYFDVTPNVDSLKPASDFLLRDIEHMLATMRWK